MKRKTRDAGYEIAYADGRWYIMGTRWSFCKLENAQGFIDHLNEQRTK